MAGTFSLTTVCNQRKRQLLFNIPPVRYTPLSPYDSGQYTQQQLDMRRKAEILSYNGNKTNTKTNNLTKAEKYALIINGKYTIDKNNYDAGTNSVLCPLDNLIPTPTSSSDVPGPIMYLYRDLTVPLYNYSSNVDSYGIVNQELPTGWTISQLDNVPCPVSINTTISSLCIRNNLDQAAYTYTINTPIAIYINGTTIGNNNVTVTLDSITLTVLFSGQQVQNINPICKINGQLITTSLPSVDISLNSQYNDTVTLYSYNAIVYIGMLTISNIVLSTAPGFVYDFRVNSMVGVVANTYPTNPLNYAVDNITPISPNYGIYCNLTNSIYSTLNNHPNKLNSILPAGSNTSTILEFFLQGQ